MRFLTAFLLLSVSPLAYGQEGLDMANMNTYSFGGACSSQGSWTQDALAGTRSLVVIAEQLKNDPHCGNLAKALNTHLASLKADVGTIAADSTSATKLSSLKEETLALRKFISGNALMKKNVLRLILDNTVESAITSTNIDQNALGLNAQSLMSVGKRINRATTSSLDILNSVMDSALQEHQCLSSPNTIGPFIGAIVQVAGAFAGSGQDSYGTKISALVSKLSNMLRDSKYTNVLKQLNQTQLRNSMSCLLEVTSESYCSALDASNLFKEQMDRFPLISNGNGDLKIADKSAGEGGLNGPLKGYYVLSQQIPIVTSWLEKIQRGVEPKLKTDAQFKNETLKVVSDFYIAENDLLGEINSSRNTLESQPTLDAKKNVVLRTVNSLTQKMVGNAVEGGGNIFFTISMRPVQIPFFLIGRDVPPVVLGQTGAMAQPPDAWLEANLPNLPEFEKPEQLLETIHTNLKSLIESSRASATSYYNEWFIYDNAALYVDAVTGMRYNVRDALNATDSYLADVEKKLKLDPNTDASLLPTIGETRSLIGSVLEKFEALRQLGQAYRSAKGDVDRKALIEKGKKLHSELVENVYASFNVQKGKSGFLANRVALIVKYDFQNLLKSGSNFSNENVKNIFYATGDAAFEKMRRMSSGNPKDIMTDLNNAQMTHKENLTALEMMMRDHFLATIAYTKMLSENKMPDDNDVRRDSIKRAWDDYWKEFPIASRNILGATLEVIAKPFDFYFSFYNGHSDRYPKSRTTTYGNNMLGASVDNENRSARHMYELYCIQSLAFSDWRFFQPLCKGVVLESPFRHTNLSPALNKVFNDTLNISYDSMLAANLSAENRKNIATLNEQLKYGYSAKVPDQARAKKLAQLNFELSRNHSSRICALRDFGRNNYVMYLTLGLK
jgi:hypothetical protein